MNVTALIAIHLTDLPPATRRQVRKADTEAEKLRIVRTALVADPAAWPPCHLRNRLNWLAERWTGESNYAALVDALSRGERPAVGTPETADEKAELDLLRGLLVWLALVLD